jgi:type IV pilus secretin PilQ/predicted competence protein
VQQIPDLNYVQKPGMRKLTIRTDSEPTFAAYTSVDSSEYTVKLSGVRQKLVESDRMKLKNTPVSLRTGVDRNGKPYGLISIEAPSRTEFATETTDSTLEITWKGPEKQLAELDANRGGSGEPVTEEGEKQDKPVGIAKPISPSSLPVDVASATAGRESSEGIVTFPSHRDDSKPRRSASAQMLSGDYSDLLTATHRPGVYFSQTAAPRSKFPKVVVNPAQVDHVPGMSRKELTIELREADIHNVLQLLAEEGNINIIASDKVQGSVTMELKSLPIDKVFLLIMQSLELGFEARRGVIRVDTQSALQKQVEQRAKSRAREQLSKPLEVFLLPINYADASSVQSQIKGLLSPRGSASVDSRTNTIIVKDLPENIGPIRKLVDRLDSEVPQVLIEARIVETNDTFERQIGIQWGGNYSFRAQNANSTGLSFPNVGGIAGGTPSGGSTQGISSSPNFAVNMPAPAGPGEGGSIGFTMGSLGGDANLNLRLSAMESRGSAKIISAPKILTLDNQQATISQGTSIPISQVSAAGVETVFVDATLELTVTPHVTPDGSIKLSIQATKNEPDFQNTGANGDPTILRKQAQTELLIDDGDTTVIGGIYTQNGGSNLSAVPYLHQIPLLGQLFKTRNTTESREELLIFITPKIVNRAESVGVLSAGNVSGGGQDWDVSLEEQGSEGASRGGR